MSRRIFPSDSETPVAPTRLSPNGTPVYETGLLLTPEMNIYSKYYQNVTSPSSPTPQSWTRPPRDRLSHTVQEDLTEESSNVTQSHDQISVEPISQESLQSTVELAVGKAIEVARKEGKISPISEFEDGFRKGIGAALTICTSMSHTKTNQFLVENQPVCTPIVKQILGALSNPDIEETVGNKASVLWERPTFISSSEYIHELDVGNRDLCLGYFAGEAVNADLVGHVDTVDQMDEEEVLFYGRCEMLISDDAGHFSGYGFILGCISATGTATIVDSRDRLYLYTPTIAVDGPWEHLGNARGAALNIDHDNNIKLGEVGEMRVAPVGSWE
jgi:hypothetical protein